MSTVLPTPVSVPVMKMILACMVQTFYPWIVLIARVFSGTSHRIDLEPVPALKLLSGVERETCKIGSARRVHSYLWHATGR